mmetsp:Transcript_53952/g.122961  ORF Transcript_53952/g.122961 Transcript_53952/m.122961 type:complete len:334 (+) Transcript_53952:163-1164(+)
MTRVEGRGPFGRSSRRALLLGLGDAGLGDDWLGNPLHELRFLVFGKRSHGVGEDATDGDLLRALLHDEGVGAVLFGVLDAGHLVHVLLAHGPEQAVTALDVHGLLCLARARGEGVVEGGANEFARLAHLHLDVVLLGLGVRRAHHLGELGLPGRGPREDLVAHLEFVNLLGLGARLGEDRDGRLAVEAVAPFLAFRLPGSFPVRVHGTKIAHLWQAFGPKLGRGVIEARKVGERAPIAVGYHAIILPVLVVGAHLKLVLHIRGAVHGANITVIIAKVAIIRRALRPAVVEAGVLVPLRGVGRAEREKGHYGFHHLSMGRKSKTKTKGGWGCSK